MFGRCFHWIGIYAVIRCFHSREVVQMARISDFTDHAGVFAEQVFSPTRFFANQVLRLGVFTDHVFRWLRRFHGSGVFADQECLMIKCFH